MRIPENWKNDGKSHTGKKDGEEDEEEEREDENEREMNGERMKGNDKGKVMRKKCTIRYFEQFTEVSLEGGMSTFFLKCRTFFVLFFFR